ncbi:hypothetical protein Tco_1325104, partial [Tanacetum coccineum]
SDPEEDPEEDDEDPEEDPTDYPADRDDDDDEEESSGDNVDEEEGDEGEDEEEEHLDSADSVSPPAYQVDKLLAIPTPPSSPLTSLSSPLPRIPSPPFPVSSPLLISPPPLPISPSHPLGFRAAMIRLRAESPSTSHPLPLPSPIVLLRTRASMVMIGCEFPRYVTALEEVYALLLVSDMDRGVFSAPNARPYWEAYTLDEIVEDHDKDEVYGRLNDAQDDRSLMSGQLNLLRRDRSSHACTARLMESKARASRKAWVQSINASDMARSETQMVALQSQQRPAGDPAHPDVPEEAGSSS